MSKNLDEYIKQPYTRILTPNEDGSYSAEILEFSGCFSDGATANEAIENLNKAARSWVEACLDQGLEIPEPFMNQDFGGKIALRLPKSLHRQAVRYAERDGISLNQFLVSAIAGKVGAEDSFARLVDRFEQRISTSAQNIYVMNNLIITQSMSNLPETKTVDLPLKGMRELKRMSTEIRQNA